MDTRLKLVSILLTTCIVYQVYYNYKASEELGEKYQELDRIIYGWVSLLPGVLLGTFIIRLSYASEDKRTSLLEKRCMYDLCSVVYLIVTALMVFVFFYTKIHVQH